MKEIEEQIYARKDEVMAAAAEKGKQKKCAAESPAEEAPADDTSAPQTSQDEDILADIDEDLDEFTPAEE